MENIYIYTTSEIIARFGTQYRSYRKMAGMTQREVAQKAGLSTITLYKFEKGMAKDLSLSTLIRLMRVIEQLDNLNALFPPIPESPYTGQTRDFDIRATINAQ